MPKYQTAADVHYRGVEDDRREAHTSSIVTLKVPLAGAALLGISAAPLAWTINQTVLKDPSSPANWVYTFAAAIPLVYILFYLIWWFRELGRLNRDAKPQQVYNSNPGLRREWVRTRENATSVQHKAVELHAEEIQLAAIAEHIHKGGAFTVSGLAQFFGNNRNAVQVFYDDLVKQDPPMGEWIDPANHKAGFRLLREGRLHLYSHLSPALPREDATPIYTEKPLYTQDTDPEDDQ